MTYPIQKTEAEWQQWLAEHQAEPLAYTVTRQAATERPHSGRYNQHWADGTYRCVCCEQPLFEASTKFDAGCGWPSFYQALDGVIDEKLDRSHGRLRMETVCSRCGAHLGHVFEDGPAPTGLRYCMNSAALDFVPDA